MPPVADAVSFGTDEIGTNIQPIGKKSVPNQSEFVLPDSEILTHSLRFLVTWRFDDLMSSLSKVKKLM